MAHVDQGMVEQILTSAAATAVAALTPAPTFRELGEEFAEDDDRVVSLVSIELEDMPDLTVSDVSGEDHVMGLQLVVAVMTSEAVEEGDGSGSGAAGDGSMYAHGSLVSAVMRSLRPKAWTGTGGGADHQVILERARAEGVPSDDDQAGVRVTRIVLVGRAKRSSGTAESF